MPHRILFLIVGLTFASFFVGCGGSKSESVNNENEARRLDTASSKQQSGESGATVSPSTSSETPTPYVDPSNDPVIQARRQRYSQASDSKREFLKSFAPEAIGEMSLDEFLRKHPDANRDDIRSNPDGSKEITWGDNLVSHNAMFFKGKLLAYRWKVVRFAKSDAEKEAKRPYEFLGKPDSNALPNSQSNIVSWNDWIVSDFLVSTGVSMAISKDGSPAYFAERHVVNQTLLEQVLSPSR